MIVHVCPWSTMHIQFYQFHCRFSEVAIGKLTASLMDKLIAYVIDIVLYVDTKLPIVF